MTAWQVLLGMLIVGVVGGVIIKFDIKIPIYKMLFGLIGIGLVAVMIYMAPVPSFLIIAVIVLVLFFKFRGFRFPKSAAPNSPLNEGLDFFCVEKLKI